MNSEERKLSHNFIKRISNDNIDSSKKEQYRTYREKKTRTETVTRY